MLRLQVLTPDELDGDGDAELLRQPTNFLPSRWTTSHPPCGVREGQAGGKPSLLQSKNGDQLVLDQLDLFLDQHVHLVRAVTAAGTG